jgi:hypothetical protein
MRGHVCFWSRCIVSSRGLSKFFGEGYDVGGWLWSDLGVAMLH